MSVSIKNRRFVTGHMVYFFFYDTRSFNEKVEFLEQAPMVVFMSINGHAIIKHMVEAISERGAIESMRPATDSEIMIRVVKAFKKCFGPLAIDVCALFHLNKVVTVLDALLSQIHDFRSMQLVATMQAMGFKKSIECHPMDIVADCRSNLGCPQEIPIQIEYGYADMKNIRKDLTKEIAETVFHPERIMRWWQKNPDKDVDEYMN